MTVNLGRQLDTPCLGQRCSADELPPLDWTVEMCVIDRSLMVDWHGKPLWVGTLSLVGFERQLNTSLEPGSKPGSNFPLRLLLEFLV